MPAIDAPPEGIRAYAKELWKEQTAQALSLEAIESAESEAPRWLRSLFPSYLRNKAGEAVPFAPHHLLAWDWVWALKPGTRPRPLVNIWARGGAKSTTAELSVAATAARRTRTYALYVCRTQDQADDHVTTIANLLETRSFALAYPAVGDRAIGKYGTSRGWRHSRLWTSSGYVVDALGVDAAMRGAKVEDKRPDYIILDDIDQESDTPATVDKLLNTITAAILPSGSSDVAIMAVQNLIHDGGVFAKLASQQPPFLTTRILNGPYPALRDFAYREREDGTAEIVRGAPTWEGQGIAECQGLVDDIGISKFLSEAQHQIEPSPGGIYDHIRWRRIPATELPALVDIVVWVDPAVSDTDRSDAQGIQCDALGVDGKVYRLWSWEQRSSPKQALRLAIRTALLMGASRVGVETDQGGDTWKDTFDKAWEEETAHDDPPPRRLPFADAKAGAGHGSKVHRQQQQLADYEHGRIIHVEGPTAHILERALRRFPKKPMDLADASYWSWDDLRHNLRPPTGKPAGGSVPSWTRMGM